MFRFTRAATARLFTRESEGTPSGHYSAVVIDPVRAGDLPNGRRAGTSTAAPPARVRWAVVTYSCLDSGAHPSGPPPVPDGSGLTPRRIELVWDLAGNRTEVLVTTRPRPGAGPHFITVDRRPVCVTHRLDVELAVTRVAELPDLEANLDDLKEVFGAVPDAESPTSLLSLALRNRDDAEMLAFRPGDDLPVALDVEPSIPGVLRLNGQRGSRDFRADLYLAAPAASVSPGIRLRRAVRWRSGGRTRELSRVVATVSG